jgi:gluconokinase
MGEEKSAMIEAVGEQKRDAMSTIVVHKPWVIFIMGVAGTGKSTLGTRLAKETGWLFLDADDFHPASNVEKMRRGQPLSSDDRWPWLETLRLGIDQQQKKAPVVIVACSALKGVYRSFLEQNQESVVWFHLTGPDTVIEARLKARENHYMGANMLQSQLRDLEPPQNGISLDITRSLDALMASMLDHLVDLVSRQSTR